MEQDRSPAEKLSNSKPEDDVDYWDWSQNREALLQQYCTRPLSREPQRKPPSQDPFASDEIYFGLREASEDGTACER
jgi:hypothetical protein